MKEEKSFHDRMVEYWSDIHPIKMFIMVVLFAVLFGMMDYFINKYMD
jgi:hypothetical protein